jgi:hypothetical protein
LFLLAVLCFLRADAQIADSSAARQLFEQERWQDLAELLDHAPRTNADLNFYYGMAMAHLERWQEARRALETGERLAPRDKRFPIELAGVAYKQKATAEAKRQLRRALRLDPGDSYAGNFLATIYFLEANLEAALKYWNRSGKPEINEVLTEPALRVRPALLDHAFAFAPATILSVNELLASDSRVRMLEIFSAYRFDLSARTDGRFDAAFRAQERNGFGNTTLEALWRTFGGIFFEEVTPEYHNVRRSATNIITLLRWDPDKRRLYGWLSGPLGADPKWRYRVGTDLRNENWTVQTSFTGPSLLLGAFNLRREAVAAEISRVAGARWTWTAGVEVSHRDYRNIFAGGAFISELLVHGVQLKQTGIVQYDLWRWPERRLTLSGALNSQAGRIWSEPGQAFEKLQASLEARWFPRAQGDDYATLLRLRGGKTFGQAPFDELFMLAVERDTDLWMRAHEGVRHGQKGSAPLGGDYVLSTFECDKNVYSNGYVTAKLGPLLDVGKAWDTSAALGSHKWLFDTGAQARFRILGVAVIFSYGKDLRSGNNTFFATVKP